MPGTYIMQWRHPETAAAAAHHHQSFDFSLSHHKCKLMYYHEVLNSDEFRGSVASLESCRSSFSSLAAAAGGQLPSSNPSTPMTTKRQQALLGKQSPVQNGTEQPSTSSPSQ